jgi:DGQHR domain-containing protein
MPFPYTALVFKQRDHDAVPSFCLFHAGVGQILQWATIKRLVPEDRAAVQRVENKAKVNQIRRFFARGETNTIPTAVIISIRGAAIELLNVGDNVPRESGLARLVIPDGVGGNLPGLIIDGQHRVLGTNAFGAGLHIPVVGLLDATEVENAFQFIVINNKASKVAGDHIRALNLNYDEHQLSERLKHVRLTVSDLYVSVGAADEDEESPFRGHIDWPNNPANRRWVVPQAIESSISYIEGTGDKAFINREAVEDFFFFMWTRIKNRWEAAWFKDSHLLEKVGIICLTKFIVDTLIAWSKYPGGGAEIDLADTETFDDLLNNILDHQEQEFWVVGWKFASYDTKVGREKILSALEQIDLNKRNRRAWGEEVEIVDFGLPRLAPPAA